MEKIIERVSEFQELGQFLAEMNGHKHSHIGYCGHNALEIERTLAEDFMDEDGKAAFFAVKKETGELTAAIGLDIDEDIAEVWGPFNRSATAEEQEHLWEACLQAYPEVRKLYFFINEENRQQQNFVQQLGARKTGEHLTLVMSKDRLQRVEAQVGRRFAPEDENAFQLLHDATFPHTYYNARTIISRLDDGRILHVIKTKADGFVGYAYFEVDPEMREAALEYIAISPAARNRGLGTILLKEVLAEIFAFPGTRDIQLCVDNANDQANHVYLKAGFERKDTLYSYVLER